jgi:hypothetical protein
MLDSDGSRGRAEDEDQIRQENLPILGTLSLGVKAHAKTSGVSNSFSPLALWQCLQRFS